MTRPPRKIHCAWSQPDENDQRPLKVKPPSVGVARPIGAYDDEMSVAGSSPHTSCWARSSKMPSCHGCTPITDDTQPVEPHALAIRRTRAVEVDRRGLVAGVARRLQQPEEAGLLQAR